MLSQLAHGAKNPPVIMIASPRDGSTIETNSVGISGVAEDEQGIERLEIFINNKPLEDKTGRGLQLKKKAQSISVPVSRWNSVDFPVIGKPNSPILIF